MEYIHKLETTVSGWVKNVPHLPVSGQKWLAQNVWWLVLIGAIISAISLLISLTTIAGLVAIIGTTSSFYYASESILTLAILSSIVALVFIGLEGLLLALAVKPLKEQQKKGWVILFALLLLNVISTVVNAIFTFSVGGFIIGIIFGAIWLAIFAYFLFEIRGQFAHVTKTVGVKKAAAKKE